MEDIQDEVTWCMLFSDNVYSLVRQASKQQDKKERYALESNRLEINKIQDRIWSENLANFSAEKLS